MHSVSMSSELLLLMMLWSGGLPAASILFWWGRRKRGCERASGTRGICLQVTPLLPLRPRLRVEKTRVGQSSNLSPALMRCAAKADTEPKYLTCASGQVRDKGSLIAHKWQGSQMTNSGFLGCWAEYHFIGRKKMALTSSSRRTPLLASLRNNTFIRRKIRKVSKFTNCSVSKKALSDDS